VAGLRARDAREPTEAMKKRTMRWCARQEKFAQLVAQGIPATQAYREAGYSDSRGHGAEGNAGPLLKRPQVAARVAEIRGMADGLGVALLTIVRKRTFLAEVVETPIGSIGPESRLCQEVYEKVEMPQEGEEGKVVLRRRMRMVDKLRAIELDSKLANHFAAAKDGDEDKAATDAAVSAKAAELLRGIADRVRNVLPAIHGTGAEAREAIGSVADRVDRVDS
jgi:hypothetical protein